MIRVLEPYAGTSAKDALRFTNTRHRRTGAVWCLVTTALLILVAGVVL